MKSKEGRFLRSGDWTRKNKDRKSKNENSIRLASFKSQSRIYKSSWNWQTIIGDLQKDSQRQEDYYMS